MELSDEDDWPYRLSLSIVPHIEEIELFKPFVLDDVSRVGDSSGRHVGLFELDYDLLIAEFGLQMGDTDNFIEFTRYEILSEEPFEAILEGRFRISLYLEHTEPDGPVTPRLPSKVEFRDVEFITRIRDFQEFDIWRPDSRGSE